MVGITPGALKSFATSYVFGVPATVIVAVLFIVVVTVVIRMTRAGRNFVIVGAAPRAARAAGINVTFYQIGTYAFAIVVATTIRHLPDLMRMLGLSGRVARRER